MKKRNNKEKREYKKKNNMTDFYMMFIMLIITITFLVYSAILFRGGYHNLDMSQNMRYLECETGYHLNDYATDNKIYGHEELYVIGYKQMTDSFIIGMFSSFLLGFLFYRIFEKYIR